MRQRVLITAGASGIGLAIARASDSTNRRVQSRRLGKGCQINLNVTRLATPHLKKSPAGVIINLSSVAGRFGYANRGAAFAQNLVRSDGNI